MLGLRPEITIQMAGKQPTSFENAISLAIGSELFIHQRNELRGIVSDTNRKRAYCHVAETDTQEEPEQKKFKCYECGDPSHSFRRCPKYLDKRRNKFRDYCRITGDIFNECRKRLSQCQGQFQGNNTPHALNSNMGRQMDTMANPRALTSLVSKPTPLLLPPGPPGHKICHCSL